MIPAQTKIGVKLLRTLANQQQHVGRVWIILYVVMPLREPIGRSLEVNAIVASQTPEDFTAHLEMHFLKHIILLIRHGATFISLTLHLLEEPKLRLLPTYTKGMNLLKIP